ncbi:helix-turn-helix domain-containing protein [Ornithinimicrobium cryptoxanthini]|uniref:Helix-turn-helix domain-containing protein n=1 Tax=Ornithinimicrobium cryptoxanthini TaxID=2934161 RepID=A0ABY4YFD3_9MICO|nr:helix-turn-helix domain-containing protein [Ornithinimicrobium cryptoxanthini]USQ75474.1 helix-turn-helix domain-containing protein [Ornithinimicrobium cryptoxanthini]
MTRDDASQVGPASTDPEGPRGDGRVAGGPLIAVPGHASAAAPDGATESDQMPFERRAATDAEARALASGLRLRILRLTLDEALTNKEIADALDRNPASVLHHVRTLVDNGFLRAEDPRRGTRGAREIPYRSTGKAWNMDTQGVTAGPIVEAFLSEIGDVPPHLRELSRMRVNGSDLPEFRKRLYDLLLEFYRRPHDAESAPHSIFVAIHPDTSTPRRHS